MPAAWGRVMRTGVKLSFTRPRQEQGPTVQASDPRREYPRGTRAERIPRLALPTIGDHGEEGCAYGSSRSEVCKAMTWPPPRGWWATCLAVVALLAPIELTSLAFRVAFPSGPSTPGGGLLPPRCERRLGGHYETRGLAIIDKLGDRYVLTVRCEGVHQIYVRVPPAMDLEPFLGKPVRARYTYADEDNPRTRCIRAPCPPATERVLDINGLEEVSQETLETNNCPIPRSKKHGREEIP
jgi:hypothetical protein